MTRSLNRIKIELLDLFKSNRLHTIVEPLEPAEEDSRMTRSIRVKIKQGWIHNRLAFRFYAVEVEEKKCYLITGAAIKIHKDMLTAPNSWICGAFWFDRKRAAFGKLRCKRWLH